MDELTIQPWESRPDVPHLVIVGLPCSGRTKLALQMAQTHLDPQCPTVLCCVTEDDRQLWVSTGLVTHHFVKGKPWPVDPPYQLVMDPSRLDALPFLAQAQRSICILTLPFVFYWVAFGEQEPNIGWITQKPECNVLHAVADKTPKRSLQHNRWWCVSGDQVARVDLEGEEKLHQEVSVLLYQLHEREAHPFSPDEQLVCGQLAARGIDGQIHEFQLEGKQLMIYRDPRSSATVDDVCRSAFPQYDVQCIDLVLTEQ